MAGMSGPPLSGESPAQAAGSSVTGPSPPQALIRRRQRLTYELRLSTRVILSRPAPQPAAGDSAVAQPTTTPFTGLVRAPEPIGDMPPRHIPSPTSLRALHCVPSGVVVRAWFPEPCPAATGGSGFTIETGSESGSPALSMVRHEVVDVAVPRPSEKTDGTCCSADRILPG